MREVNVQSDEVMLKFGWYAAQSAGQEHEVVHNMADEIVRLREALAAATRVRVLDEWHILRADGGVSETGITTSAEAHEARGYHDVTWPADAPHRVVRVALVDADSHQSVPSDYATRVTDEMVAAAHRAMLSGPMVIGTETVRAMLTAALEGPRD